MAIEVLTRAAKGSPLTATEADADITALATGLTQTIATMDASFTAANAAITAANATITTGLSAANADIADVRSQITAGLTDVNTTTTQLHNSFNTLYSNVGGSLATITQLGQTLATETQARTTQYNDLSAQVASNAANVTSLNTALATETSSRTSQINSLTSTVAGHTSSITTINQTISDMSTSQASAISALQTSMGQAQTDITSLQSSVSTNQSSTATSITNLQSSLATTQSNLTSLQQTVATADSATATSITNMQTTLSGHTTSIATLQTSVNGITASWGVQINNNGRVTGLLLSSGADSKSTFAVMADKFQIIDPSNNAYSPFTVANGNVYVDSVMSTNYAAPSAGVAPTGYKLQSTPFTTTYMDGSTASVDFELGTNANFGGYPVGTLTTAVFNRSISYTNPGYYRWLCPDGVYWIDAVVVDGGNGGHAGGDTTYIRNTTAVYGCPGVVDTIVGDTSNPKNISFGGGGGNAGSTAMCRVPVFPGKSYIIRVAQGGSGEVVVGTVPSVGTGTTTAETSVFVLESLASTIFGDYGTFPWYGLAAPSAAWVTPPSNSGPWPYNAVTGQGVGGSAVTLVTAPSVNPTLSFFGNTCPGTTGGSGWLPYLASQTYTTQPYMYNINTVNYTGGPREGALPPTGFSFSNHPTFTYLQGGTTPTVATLISPLAGGGGGGNSSLGVGGVSAGAGSGGPNPIDLINAYIGSVGPTIYSQGRAIPALPFGYLWNNSWLYSSVLEALKANPGAGGGGGMAFADTTGESLYVQDPHGDRFYLMNGCPGSPGLVSLKW